MSEQPCYRLDFRRVDCDVDDDRVVVWIPRDRLGELAAFCEALRLGLVDVKVTPAGRG
jgi:hypothetical protein